MMNRSSAISEIRATFRMFGYDLSDRSDEEIERAAINMQQAIIKFGVTATEVLAMTRKMAELSAVARSEDGQ